MGTINNTIVKIEAPVVSTAITDTLEIELKVYNNADTGKLQILWFNLK
jgi:hypothetical protein